MMTPARGKLVAFVTTPRTARDVLRLASPRYEVIVAKTATAALGALQSAGDDAVLVAEHVSTPPPAVDSAVAPDAARPAGFCAAALLEAARIRCPSSRRLLLAGDEHLTDLIPLLHNGAAHIVVPLPIVAKEFVSAISTSRGGVAASA